ncbi:MAG TPA: VWA domain-containing protein [candidate division Zixibacteria bacterium]|nr:VWA domain-containing protein [candidate division Zixibacteria bacterium]HER00376.1 VWA domain-containing protein [candidate division Zixibacteria bacterium]
MRFIYSEWDDAAIQKLQNLKDLMSIFNYLLLQVNGDAEMALKLMRKLQAMGVLPEDFDLDGFEKNLEKSNIVSWQGDNISLTRKGEKSLRQDAFDSIFEHLRKSGAGGHIIPHGGGSSEEALPEKREYRFGDEFNHIDFQNSLMNTIRRTGSLGLNMAEKDLEVYDTEQLTNCATVMLIDISHSMVLYGEDRITPAKQVALAFSELILTKYPKDSLNIVLFGDFAREVKVKDIPYIGVGPYHTNTKAGLEMARNILLKKKNVNKQIFMITDGKPSMITRRNGSVYKNPMGLDPVIVNRTLDEAIICRKKRIPITTFMITDDPYLQKFVAKLTELNRGRAYFASSQNLGDYVFWDFVSRRRKKR